MAEISPEQMYEVLKQIRDEVSSLRQGQAELKAEMQAMRGHMVAMQQDTQNIYTILVRHETRLNRIDRRLELVKPASA